MPYATWWWSPENKARLVDLIAEGVTASEAGRRLGISKNMVIGKCNREGITLARARGPRKPVQPPTPNPFPPLPLGGCLWPYGDPDDPLFHFCGGHRYPGKPYCAAHAAIAYIPPDAKNLPTAA